MYRFRTTIHARPTQIGTGKPMELRGRIFETLGVRPESLSVPLGPSFEQAAASLRDLPRMFVEPDGSFVWVAGDGESRWQVDGNLFDRDGRLIFIELHGECPEPEFDRLLAAFGWPRTPVLFQLSREAVFLDEAEFRRFAQLTSTDGPQAC